MRFRTAGLLLGLACSFSTAAMVQKYAGGHHEHMKEEQQMDPDLFDIFIRDQVHLQNARNSLGPNQVDAALLALTTCLTTAHQI